jgi:hypothetical protein
MILFGRSNWLYDISLGFFRFCDVVEMATTHKRIETNLVIKKKYKNYKKIEASFHISDYLLQLHFFFLKKAILYKKILTFF